MLKLMILCSNLNTAQTITNKIASNIENTKIIGIGITLKEALNIMKEFEPDIIISTNLKIFKLIKEKFLIYNPGIIYLSDPKEINELSYKKAILIDHHSDFNSILKLISNFITKNVSISKKEQIILFLNRRGFSTFVSCRSCGYVFKCEECDISMTYHRNGLLVCHYCGKTKSTPKKCPKCDSKYVKFFGAGTQRVEEEVKKYFKEAKVLRMDVDTTRSKDSYENIYNTFKDGKADILIGTQMISKGLDFKNVTLVGILAADMSINIPDYRASERTFQIITQVAGRAGRGEKQGNVIIQTYTPDHYSLKYAINYDYEGFYEREFTVRALMKYPPFGKILLINAISKKEDLLKQFMHKISNGIKLLVEKEKDIDVLGPIPCLIAKVKENYRWQIVIKGEFESEFAKKIKELLYDKSNNVYNDIRISIDINPNNLF